MRTKIRKLAGLLLIFVMMTAGICGEALKTDAVFVQAQEGAQRTCISMSGTELSDAEACTAEMLGSRRNTGSGRLMVRHANQRRGNDASLHFLCQNIYSPNRGNSGAGCDALIFVSESSSGLIANYIHKSDGKKRI